MSSNFKSRLVELMIQYAQNNNYILRDKLNISRFESKEYKDVRDRLNLQAVDKALKELWSLEWFKSNNDFDTNKLITPEKIKVKGEKKKSYEAVDIMQAEYPLLTAHSFTILSQANGGTSAKKKLTEEDKEKKLAINMMKDLHNMETQSPQKSPDSPAWYYASQYSELRDFFDASPERFVNDVTKKFDNILIDRLIDERNKYLQRKTLGNSYEFSHTDTISFFGNLRLSIRDQKRNSQNFKYNSLQKTLFTGTQRKFFQRGWVFGNIHKVAESQSLVGGSQGRQDEVDNAGAYSIVAARIEQIKAFFQVYVYI